MIKRLGLITSYARDIYFYKETNTKEIKIWWPGHFSESFLQTKSDIEFVNLTPLNFFEVPIIIDKHWEYGWATKWHRQKLRNSKEIVDYDNIMINIVWWEFKSLDFSYLKTRNIFIDLWWFKWHYKKINLNFTKHIAPNTNLFIKVSDYETKFISKKLLDYFKQSETLIITKGKETIEVYEKWLYYEYKPKIINTPLSNTIWAWDTFFASFTYNYILSWDIDIAVKKSIKDVYYFLLWKKNLV